MHGHWDIKEEDMNDVEIVSVDRKNNERQGVNLGIALVVPAKRILEILHQPALVDGRRRHDRESRDAEGATAPDADWPT
jgi:hypothetical protein